MPGICGDLRTVLVGVMFCCFSRVMSGVKAMAVRYIRMVRRCFVVARFMMLCRLSMVLCRVPVMLCRFLMVFRAFVI
jgi:hypothetical protein